MPTNTLHYNIKFLQLKHYAFGMFRPYPVGHLQRVYANIRIKCRL